MTMIFFTIIFTLLAIVCVVTFYIDSKIQKHIFNQHPKILDSFGYPYNSRGTPDTYSSEYNEAVCKLVVF